ncbi:2-octaprenyl-6-methoxyphenyl hydroxylase [Aerolutibacter ruishenii]|uniref:2-octaprenyl-6-methoxyphenol hydroxylase n=1 Tax=Aerolutibacter ruishenii TaxID=686800 RepID=A0A562M2P7_9GAMM|nr:2-octaprenyl-6-methoxyphenyl hydroxylase [Lysobacter ruishenii]TWI14058.1 2-octaprenyl-6-methoxyphenol hydroxylase [Lysobacter ruishenii]
MPETSSPPGHSPAAATVSPVHDVLIVGGGLVGSSLAIALDRIGLDVGLVEASPPGGLPPVFDERNLSFAEATVNALTALGVMQKLRTPTGAIQRIHVSREGDFGRVLLDAAAYGRDAFGQVVVARDFGEALEARLAELVRLVRYRPVRFAGLADDAADAPWRSVRLVDEGGERIVRTRLLVAADGTRSGVRAALGIGTVEHDYGHHLFVTRLRTDRAVDGNAFERLTDAGPTALLPRGDRHYGLIHGVANHDVAAVAAMPPDAFLQRVQGVFGWRAGRFLAAGTPSVYPAVRVLAERLVGPRTVLMGNAAQTIHPIGAQGFNLGLRDALTLAELVAAARAADAAADCGAPTLLERYVARRQEDRERTLAFSDGLARLTSNPTPLMRPLRSIGLFAIGRVPSLQAAVVAGALGYRGAVPALCRRTDA